MKCAFYHDEFILLVYNNYTPRLLINVHIYVYVSVRISIYCSVKIYMFELPMTFVSCICLNDFCCCSLFLVCL